MSSDRSRVHLDHLIRRQSIRYIFQSSSMSEKNNRLSSSAGQEDRALRYEDIMRKDGWFTFIRKPDFQRETSAWTPQDCIDFLDSVVRGRIIPSIILWQSKENNFTYILDGAHRLSVLRAWMIDDWGDKAAGYYERRDQTQILEAARETRDLVRREIGLFKDFQDAAREFMEIADQGKVQKDVMGQSKYLKATFYQQVVGGLHTLSAQWERGNYESAEQSFLRINRKGQALDPWEATLIEHRRSSYARCIMSIANGGKDGHYWPEPQQDELPENLIKTVASFSDKTSNIYQRLFVPPYSLPVADLTVPMMVGPDYFQKHKYLLELIPLLYEKQIIISEEQQIEVMRRDENESAEIVIKNADQILSSVLDSLEHLVSPQHNSKCLSIVPLFYWYNHQGKYIRGLFYGFMYWLLAGSDNDIITRKLFFSIHRERFETILFKLKPEISTFQDKAGAGLKGVRKAAKFFQALFELFGQKSATNNEELEKDVIGLLQDYGRIRARTSSQKSSRSYSSTDKSQINIRQLFENSIRCHICEGIVNLRYGGLQYDHVEDYAATKITDPETGRPTHPFCNRQKAKILASRAGTDNVFLPAWKLAKTEKEDEDGLQQMAFWGDDNFPD